MTTPWPMGGQNMDEKTLELRQFKKIYRKETTFSINN